MNATCSPSRVYRVIVKPHDGPISKYINRRISLIITCFLINHNITPSPNKVTIFTTLFGLLSAYIATINPIPGGILIQLASILDGIDGEIARLTQRTTKFGAFLDSLLDRIVDASITLAISLHLLEILDPYIGLLTGEWLLVSMLLVSFLHARGEASLGIKLQLVGIRIYASRDVRLFLLSLALVLLPITKYAYLALIFLTIILSTIYIIVKTYYAWRETRE